LLIIKMYKNSVNKKSNTLYRILLFFV
jgi:hypothetical protein